MHQFESDDQHGIFLAAEEEADEVVGCLSESSNPYIDEGGDIPRIETSHISTAHPT